MKTIKFDSQKLNFKARFEQFLNLGLLENLNLEIEVLKRENDQKTPIHTVYYEWARTEEFQNLYVELLRDYVKPLYDGEEIVYQKIPTFRVAFPNNIAVGEFHKDKAYRDLSWAEQVKEDNFFLPFTDAFDTNTIWVESEEDKGDFAPMNCEYGNTIQWNGSNLTHGNKINETGKARVSVDFRVIRMSNYTPSTKGSINMNVGFAIGGYYDVI